MRRSYVVTGGGSGIGRVIAERQLADGGAVVVLDHDGAALGWASAHPARPRVIPLAGDATVGAVTDRAADLAAAAGGLAGWVNNAAVFRNACIDAVPAHEVTELINANLSLAVTGCGRARRASSTAPSSPSTAGGPRSAPTRSRHDGPTDVQAAGRFHLVAVTGGPGCYWAGPAGPGCS
jgi:NAD(P)-dependent dehydrogenase (short-subunit alcohol dehydrogenase family)